MISDKSLAVGGGMLEAIMHHATAPGIGPMLICRALRLRAKDVVSLTGGGGKTTLMFRLAAELAGLAWRVVTTMTTRIFVGQMAVAPPRLYSRTNTHFSSICLRHSPCSGMC